MFPYRSRWKSRFSCIICHAFFIKYFGIKWMQYELVYESGSFCCSRRLGFIYFEELFFCQQMILGSIDRFYEHILHQIRAYNFHPSSNSSSRFFFELHGLSSLLFCHSIICSKKRVTKRVPKRCGQISASFNMR